ncbi:HAMP domain-containing protein [Bacteriovorax sp. DB6_IX]|uniref:HAMP domain-containing protein n=1 Tax=Bacteriovorax sp. DB6_IX TaxID=1353530 RepID=UPI000389E60A|nr:HAMP domain-containing protein [Bacteriovorax sp. DB6_IX]EQC52466.1 HAMP domain protein [Bacteriovorax sp. DB6_IX]
MNLSLRNRVATSFFLAGIVVIVLSFIIFHHLNSLNKDIQSVSNKSNRATMLTDEIRISVVRILKKQREILANKPTPELIQSISNSCEVFTSQLQRLDSLYSEPEIKKNIGQMLSYVDSLKVVLGKASLFHRDNIGMTSVGELADKILESFTEFQYIQYSQNKERDKKMKEIIKATKGKMMTTLISAFLWIIILGLVIPGKIALPFKKIKDAIRELQDCNFDVSIYYSQDDEIGEIAREMNKMIHSFKIFEELRADRILVENRKFDVLANMVKRPVLLANAKGELIYLNNKVYSLLQVQSEDCIGKVMTETVIPQCIIDTYDLAIKRRSKIENQEIAIEKKEESAKNEKELGDKISHKVDIEGEGNVEEGEEEKPVEYVYQGYASVIPIRGKESSLDYYLMVMSKEVYTA